MTAIVLTSIGAAMLCFMIPEFMAAMMKRPAPLVTNLWCAIGGALLTVGLMLQGA